MSMFPFADDWMSPQARENPFVALMPGMEPLQKTTEDWLRGMGVPRVPDMSGMAVLPDAKAIEANMETMLNAVPGFEGMPNLATHPVAAMAAGTAVSMGAASQMMGTMFGAMTGMMDTAMRMQKATREVSPFAPPGTDMTNPLKFEWAFGLAEEMAGNAATVAETTPKAEVRAPRKKATARSNGKTKLALEPAAAVAPTPDGAPAATIPAAEAVATELPARPGGPAPLDIMPEDFRQPRKVEKPASPDDLKMISGVGPKLESVLNSLGIWTFAQIAEWTPEEVAWVDDYLQFKGRIERDGWIAQAAALAKGGRDEYVRMFGKEPR
ncbi:NADH-ubiquinone dehydrogenase [Roseitalea porphyridii]|uniref:NADH-ubiquinone dehydrogenase n=1 Tax=Roseitalea porphyridii TaxID=1852022 RepID=UPI001FCEFA96|nr:NADH-ubiquinone dehydrogenase [Roseitalea porphyridii]